MLHIALLPYFREYFKPVEPPEMFSTVYRVLFLTLLQRQLSNLNKILNTSSLPECFRHLK